MNDKLKVSQRNFSQTINKIIEVIPITGLGIIIFIILLQIFLRYVFYHPLYWSDELATTLEIWVVYVGAYIVLIRNGHVKLEYFMSFLPKKWEPWLELFINIICSVFVFFLTFSVITVFIKTFHARTAAMGLPMPLIFLSGLICSILMLMHFVITIIKGFRFILGGIIHK